MNTPSRPLAAFALVCALAASFPHLAANPGNVHPFTLTLTGPASQKLTWTSIAGARYVVQVSNNLGGWTDVDVVTATGTTTMWNDPYPRLTPKGFYRLVTPQAQVTAVHPMALSSTGPTTVYFLGECFTGTELFYLNNVLTAGLVFDSATQLHIMLPLQPVGIYELKITDSLNNPLAGGIVTVMSNPQGLRFELPPVNPPAAPTGGGTRICIVEPAPASPSTPRLDLELLSEPVRGGASTGPAPANGEYRLQTSDLVVPGVGLDFDFTRTYRSLLGTDTPMGQGWDFSYNIRAQKNSPTAVTVFDGAGRADVFTLGTGGVFECPERFEGGALSGGGTVFTLTFPDGGKWEFGAFGALPGPANLARITASRDRNNNAITFAYDLPTGRLMTITDTVGHAYTLAYAGTRIASLTDFAGRVVLYTHDANGDLVQVTSPAVVGTPNGNDFPAGKTTTFTYSSGFGDPRLNHNLLTVTDGLGQTPLVFTYATTLVPTDVEFDRVERVQCGTPGQDIVLSYQRLTPSPGNLFAVIKTYVNDRNGHLTEYEYDSLNRPVRVRRYTGSCVPGVAVTAAANRPGAPLRAGDPAFYTSRADWNRDSLCTKLTMPRGNTIEYFHEMDLRTAGSVPARNKARLLLHRQRADVLGVYDQDEIVMRFVHDDRFGAGRGVAFPTQVIDGRGYATQMGYDVRANLLSVDRALVLASPAMPAGGVVQLADYTYNAAGQCISVLGPHNGTARRLDTFTYYGPGPQAGWLASVKVNDGGLNLVTSREYNVAGALVRTVDPRGNDTLVTPNALNQPVRIQSRDAAGAGRGRIHIFYDANNNVVQTDTANKDQNGVVQPNAEFTSTWTHDILNCVLDCTAEIDAVTTATRSYVYDAGRNVTDILSPLAVAGIQPTNTIHIINDERNLPFTIVFGPGSPEQSSTRYDYDANRNPATITQGLEGATPRVSTRAWDTFSSGEDECILIHVRLSSGQVQTPSDARMLAVDRDQNPYAGGLERPASSVVGGGVVPPLARFPWEDPIGGGGILWDPPIGGPAPPPVVSGPNGNGWLIDPERPPLPPVDFYRPMDGGVTLGTPNFVTGGLSSGIVGGRPGEGDDAFSNLSNFAWVAPSGAFGWTTVVSRERSIGLSYALQAEEQSIGTARGSSGDAGDALISGSCPGWVPSQYNIIIGAGRPTSVTDPMGNKFEFHYDAGGNCVDGVFFGELNDVPGSTNNVLLGERTIVVDPLNRPVSVNDAHFNPATGLNIGDGQRTTTSVWTDSGALKTLTDDRGNNTNWFFDGAGRCSSAVDANGNVTFVNRDANGNVTTFTSTEKSDLGSADHVFTTDFGFDARDRVTFCTYPLTGNTDNYGYDSRSNMTTHVNARGVADFWLLDGLYSVTLHYRDMDNTGTLTAPDIQKTITLDLNTRPVAITDDNGHATTKTFDALNRCFLVTLADGTQTNSTFDVHHNVTARTDANGTQVLSQFSLNNLPTQLQIIPGPGVAPTTQQQTFSWEGRGLPVAATTSGVGFAGPITHQCALSHDSHGNVLTDTQDTATTTSTHDGVGNLTQLIHPTGRVVNYTNDALNRCSTVHDGAPVASFFYFGPDRTERILNGNGTRTDITWDGVNGVPNPPGDFGFRQVIRKTHIRVSDGLVIDDHSFMWDRAQNKIQRKDNRIGGPQLTHAYGYDNDDRLVTTQVTNAVPAIVRQTTRTIDGANNQLNAVGFGTPNAGPNVLNAGAPTFDFEVNQYSNTPIGAHAYSSAGETTNIAGVAQLAFDFKGTLVQYQPFAAPNPTALYDSDPFGRRVKRVINPAGAAVVTTFGYAGGTLVTENPAAGTPKDFISSGNTWFVDPFDWRDNAADGIQVQCIRGPVNVWIHTDDLGNTMAESNTVGGLAQSFEYGDYGAPNAPSTAGNPWLFGGMRYDSETGLHKSTGPRQLDPRTGAWLSPDPSGAYYDPSSNGNARSYCGANPWSFVDPSGNARAPTGPPPLQSDGPAAGGGTGQTGSGGGMAQPGAGGSRGSVSSRSPRRR